MSPTDQARAALLMVAALMALGSALFMLESVYDGARSEAWLWAAVFFVSSAVAAWCFGRLM